MTLHVEIGRLLSQLNRDRQAFREILDLLDELPAPLRRHVLIQAARNGCRDAMRAVDDATAPPCPPPDLSETLALLRRYGPRLKERYGIVILGVFGSVARGEAGPRSDVDLLVRFDGEGGDYFRVQRVLSKLLRREADIGHKLREGVDEMITQELVPL